MGQALEVEGVSHPFEVKIKHTGSAVPRGTDQVNVILVEEEVIEIVVNGESTDGERLMLRVS